jgi:chromosome segregation ATPase
LDESIAVKEKAKATIAEVDAMGHSLPLVPGVHFTADEAQKIKTLAKKSVNYDKQIADSKKKLETVKAQMAGLESELTAMTRDRNIWKQRFEDLQRKVEPFMSAIINFPQVLKDFISRHWQERQQQKSHHREELR